MFRLFIITSVFTVFISCKNSRKPNGSAGLPNNDSLSTYHTPSVNDFAIVEPVKKFIYYMNEVDITTYDSISTQYFHEVMDYTDSAAIALEVKINQLELVIATDTTTAFQKQVAADEISELSLELLKYEKDVTGYVFVHTFLNNGDTLSAIIITNAEMTKGEAIPVSTPNDIEPTAFTNNIRKIDQ